MIPSVLTVRLPQLERASPAARARVLAEAAADLGEHPLTVPLRTHIPLHRDAPAYTDRTAPGPRCGGCALRALEPDHGGRRRPKCSIPGRSEKGPGTEVRAWWPACTDWRPR